MPYPHGRRTTGSEDAVATNSVGDTGDDDGDGNFSLSSAFTRCERLFQQLHKRNKAAKYISRAEAHLMREAAANMAALEPLASSAAQRTAVAFCSTPEASNWPERRKWWANMVRQRLQESEDMEEDQHNDRGLVDNGMLFMAMASATCGQGARGHRQ